MIEIRRYVTPEGRNVLGDYLEELSDGRAHSKITIRIDRLAEGNFGDSKALGNGLHELRIDWGPGYRVYYAMHGQTCVVLLCAGDKRRQSSDIDKALTFWKDYKNRMNP